MVIEYDFTEADWKAFFDWHRLNSNIKLPGRCFCSRSKLIWIYALAAVAISSAFAFLIIEFDIFVLLIAAICIYAIFSRHSELKSMHEELKGAKTASDFGVRSLTINEHSLRDKGLATESLFDFKDISGWEESDEFICIFQRFPNCVLIPKRHLSCDEHLAILKTLEAFKRKNTSRIALFCKKHSKAIILTAFFLVFAAPLYMALMSFFESKEGSWICPEGFKELKNRPPKVSGGTGERIDFADELYYAEFTSFKKYDIPLNDKAISNCAYFEISVMRRHSGIESRGDCLLLSKKYVSEDLLSKKAVDFIAYKKETREIEFNLGNSVFIYKFK